MRPSHPHTRAGVWVGARESLHQNATRYVDVCVCVCVCVCAYLSQRGRSDRLLTEPFKHCVHRTIETFLKHLYTHTHTHTHTM